MVFSVVCIVSIIQHDRTATVVSVGRVAVRERANINVRWCNKAVRHTTVRELDVTASVCMLQSERCIRVSDIQNRGASEPLRSAVHGRPRDGSADIPAEVHGTGVPTCDAGQHAGGLHAAGDGRRPAVCHRCSPERNHNDARPLPELHWFAGIISVIVDAVAWVTDWVSGIWCVKNCFWALQNSHLTGVTRVCKAVKQKVKESD